MSASGMGSVRSLQGTDGRCRSSSVRSSLSSSSSTSSSSGARLQPLLAGAALWGFAAVALRGSAMLAPVSQAGFLPVACTVQSGRIMNIKAAQTTCPRAIVSITI